MVAQPVIEKSKEVQKKRLYRKKVAKLDSLPSLAVKPSEGGFGGDATESLTARSCTQSDLDAWAHDDSVSATMDSNNGKSRKAIGGRNRIERVP